jgi:hypothetical protein
MKKTISFCKNSTSKICTSHLLLAYALIAFCGNIFPYIAARFFCLLNNTKRHLFWWLALLSSPWSIYPGNSSYGDNSRAKAAHKYFDFWQWSLCWDHAAREIPARAVLKMFLRNSKLNTMHACLSVTHTTSPFIPVFSLHESCITPPQFFCLLWLWNQTNCTVYSFLS